MLGKLYHIRQETVERYATYAKAIDIVRAAVPELAEGLLFGRLFMNDPTYQRSSVRDSKSGNPSCCF